MALGLAFAAGPASTHAADGLRPSSRSLPQVFDPTDAQSVRTFLAYLEGRYASLRNRIARALARRIGKSPISAAAEEVAVRLLLASDFGKDPQTLAVVTRILEAHPEFMRTSMAWRLKDTGHEKLAIGLLHSYASRGAAAGSVPGTVLQETQAFLGLAALHTTLSSSYNPDSRVVRDRIAPYLDRLMNRIARESTVDYEVLQALLETSRNLPRSAEGYMAAQRYPLALAKFMTSPSAAVREEAIELKRAFRPGHLATDKALRGFAASASMRRYDRIFAEYGRMTQAEQHSLLDFVHSVPIDDPAYHEAYARFLETKPGGHIRPHLWLWEVDTLVGHEKFWLKWAKTQSPETHQELTKRLGEFQPVQPIHRAGLWECVLKRMGLR